MGKGNFGRSLDIAKKKCYADCKQDFKYYLNIF